MPRLTEPEWITPDWPAPASVCAISTTRQGGTSAAPYDSLNLAHHVDDDRTAVAANRRVLSAQLPEGTRLHWLNQVHGARVVSTAEQGLPAADAIVSKDPKEACCVLAADCLPVLFCSRQGDVVAAAHAGWRGLAAGVLECAVEAMNSAREDVMAWLGPAIGPGAFQVGEDVRTAFSEGLEGGAEREVQACFVPDLSRPGYFLANLYAIARLRLHGLGVNQVYGGQNCTYTEADRFYSYRRDGCTGRMASVIVLR
ncbi:MAG: peptidoglycan editing factor PgeF [Halioglobus sp.]